MEPEDEIGDLLEAAGLPRSGKTTLHDGHTGEPFLQKVTVGYAYMMTLSKLVDDIACSRSTGLYSLEAYRMAYILRELLTIKSDDVNGRSTIYETLVKGQNSPPPGTPQSFNCFGQRTAELESEYRDGKT